VSVQITSVKSSLNAVVSVSAGFDAADGDDLGECHVTPAGYAHMTHMLCSLGGGRIVVALEVSAALTSE
jgi:acetoin utilization deacetylase AcuC-like enzyme